MLTNLLSAKSFAAALDCSLSMLYRLWKEDQAFPEPAVKLFGQSKRGHRWTEQQVAEYIALKDRQVVAAGEDTEPAPAFVKIKLKRVA